MGFFVVTLTSVINDDVILVDLPAATTLPSLVLKEAESLNNSPEGINEPENNAVLPVK